MTTHPESRRADPERRVDHLRELCELLWPSPARSTIGRRSTDDPPDAEYLLVPDARRPKMVLPARPARAASAAVTGFNTGRSRRARVLSDALRVALRTPVTRAALRDRIRVYGPTDATLPAHLRAELGTELVLAFQIGPSRANRKPVLQLLSPDGQVLGYTKIGVNPLTERLVRAEADALRTLAGADLATLTVPAIRHAGRWQDHEVLTQQALPVWRTAVAPVPHRITAAMRELTSVGGLRDDPLSRTAYWTGLRHRAAGLPTAPHPAAAQAAALNAALERLAGYGDTPLRFGAWHGDWTTWNMLPLARTILMWDWERFATGVPVGFDALHLRLQDATTRDRIPPVRAVADTAARAPRLLAPFGVPNEHAPLVAALYFAEITVRYLADDQTRAGSWLGTELIPALTAHIA